MASTGTPSGGNIEGQVRRIEDRFDEYLKVSASVKNTGRLMTVILSVILLFLVYRLLEPLLDLYNRRMDYAVAMQQQIEESIAPKLQAEAKDMFEKDLKPFIEETVANEVPVAVQRIAATLEAEAVQLGSDLKLKFDEELATRGAALNDKYVAKLKEDFPTLADERSQEEAFKNLQLALDDATARVLRDHFDTHRKAILRAGEAFDGFEVPAELKDMTNDQLLNHTFGLLVELIGARFAFSDAQTVSSAAGDSPTALAAAK
ncbi:MAG: hypothetical protein SF028_12030 [Candidatus Sumerlaeia bacterium]|nr:hypothetical protein [Candidatus Sumerlaeia bacterium]